MQELVKQTNAWACYDCGKCTATCPISRAGAAYSPRRHVLATNLGQREAVSDGSLFTCLTCGLCDSRCPAEVDYGRLILGLRELAFEDKVEPECPHGGALQSLMRMMARGGTRQDRLGWLDDSLDTDPGKGRVFLWTGCTMYYDAFFPEHGVTTLNGTRAAIKVLNALGEKPVVSPEERCCGHDLLWNGDRASYEALARHNVELVTKSGAEILVAPCAECLRTWRVDYRELLGPPPFQVMHLTELVADRLPDLKLHDSARVKVTFQDPCRLGRHLGVYGPPRQVLGALPGVEVTEMGRSGLRATCCAGGTWSSCDRFAKQIQEQRLGEARGTGAEVLVTACPKCQVHFRCAMHDPAAGEKMTIEMRDVAEMVAAALE